VVDHSNVELLACPFCGEFEIVRTEVWSGFHAKWVDTQECKCCGAAAPVEVWNHRYTDPAQTAPQPEQSGLVEALVYYANGDHMLLADPDAWDTCSGEPLNFLHDEAGTASVEDGTIAKAALDAYRAALSAKGGEA